MAVTRLLNLLALSSLAILACSYGATPVNALTVDTHHLARSPIQAHAALAKKKRGAKRCKPRPSSSVVKPTVPPTQPPAKPTSTKVPPPTTSSTNNNGGGAPPPSSGGNSGSKGKVGLAWPITDDKALAYFKTDNVSPIYTWSPWIPVAAKKLGFNGIPMLWGEKQVEDFKRIVVQGYANTVLGFNEPNQQGQSDMSPQRGVQLWKQYILPLKSKGYRLISPACTNAPSGKKWMQDFLSMCNGGCAVDGFAVHFYGTDAQALIDFLIDMHNTFKLPIWLTEFACENFSGGQQCSKDEVFNFMKKAKDFMDNTPWVETYFAFGAMYDMGNVNPLNQLLGDNGRPTDLGYMYIN